MRRLLVNDALNQLGEHTFWNDLVEWFGCEFYGSDFSTLADNAGIAARGHYVSHDATGAVTGEGERPATLIIRNATWFPPIKTQVPTISLLQDIVPSGPIRQMQDLVIGDHGCIVFNSEFTRNAYLPPSGEPFRWDSDEVIPLPVDFTVFEPQNAMGCQQALSLPDGCVLWVGACQGAAGHVKGWDIFVQVVRQNPDIPFVAVLKDGAPESVPPNLRYYVRLTHQELVRVIGACRVGLCTSRTESQHLAGIEMGACGLPMVAPNTGVYWNRNDSPVIRALGTDAKDYSDCLKWSSALREVLRTGGNMEYVRNYWRKEFDKPVIKAQWTKLIEEVEQQ